jgi:hypothetical protein
MPLHLKVQVEYIVHNVCSHPQDMSHSEAMYINKRNLHFTPCIRIYFIIFVARRQPTTKCSTHILLYISTTVVPMAERSEARTAFGRSNIGIVGSNTIRGMDVYPRFAVLCCPV